MKQTPSFERILVVRAGVHRCAIRLEHVVEVMRPLMVETIAGGPSAGVGLARVRGEVTPVIDLGALLCDRIADAGAVGRFVLLRVERRCVALAVRDVVAIRTLRSEDLAELPRLWREPRNAAVALVGARDPDLLYVLDAARLLPDDLGRGTGEGSP